MDKDKKKTLTISSDLKKKIDTSTLAPSGKKSFSVKKKNLLRLVKILTEEVKILIFQKARIQKKILQENL